MESRAVSLLFLILQKSLVSPPTAAPTWEGKWVGAVASDQPLPDPRPTTADLLSSLEDLELSNRRLARENSKLQRSLETAEEGSTRLGEEIMTLRKQLRRWALHVLSLHLLPCLPPCTVPSALFLFLFCVSLALVSQPLGFRLPSLLFSVSRLPSLLFSLSPYLQPMPALWSFSYLSHFLYFNLLLFPGFCPTPLSFIGRNGISVSCTRFFPRFSLWVSVPHPPTPQVPVRISLLLPTL